MCQNRSPRSAALRAILGVEIKPFGGFNWQIHCSSSEDEYVDLAAVITYQRNAFGNNMGDMVQPIDVFNYKKGQ